MITLSHLIKTYGSVTALDVPELTIEEGQIVGLVGNNGAGKTTMMRLMLDLIRADPAAEAAAAESAPWLLERTYDTERWADPEFVINITVEVTGNRFINKDAEVPQIWTDDEEAFLKFATVGDNLGFSLGENPCFVNPTRGDYRVIDCSGFPDCHFELIGRY